MPGVVCAQAKPSEVVIVTGTTTARALGPQTTGRSNFSELEAPFVVSNVTADKISDRGLTSLQDALRVVSSTAPITGIGGFNTRFRIRGFLASNNLVNGFRQQVSFPILDVASIERIDVLKGPASALYGRLEPGGAINIVTKTPQDTHFAQFGVMGDSEGLARVTLDINQPFGAGLKGRLNIVSDNGDGFRDFVDNKTVFAAPSLSFANETTSVVVEAAYSKKDGVFDRGFVSSPLTLTLPNSRFLGERGDSFKAETSTASGRVSQVISDTIMLRFGGSISKSTSEGDYYFPIGAGGALLLTPAGILNRRNQTTRDEQEDASVGWEITKDFALGSTKNTLLIAGEWSKDESTSLIRRATVNAPISIFNPQYGAVKAPISANIIQSRSTNEGLGLLAQVETRFGAKILTTVALRGDRLRARFVDGLSGAAGTSNEIAVLPRVGATYLPTSNIALFVNWGQSFAPEAGTRPVRGLSSAKPSQGEQVELGTRLQNNGGTLRASASIFQITKSNVRVAEAGPSLFDVQVGEQRSRGFELEAMARPFANIEITGAYTSIEAEVTKDRILAGKTLQAVPENSASVAIMGRLTEELTIELNGFYVGSRFVDTANTFELPAFERFDASLIWKPNERLALQLNVLNLSDQRYFENGNTNNNFYPGQPRTVRARLSLKL